MSAGPIVWLCQWTKQSQGRTTG